MGQYSLCLSLPRRPHPDRLSVPQQAEDLRPLLAAAQPDHLEGQGRVVHRSVGDPTQRRVTTLGRGGSDTSAVAIAAALGPASCLIVTDVDAVYDRDPQRHQNARPLRRLSHDQLFDLARSGAQVVAAEAARLARAHGVPLRVVGYDAPPQDEECGTFVGVAR